MSNEWKTLKAEDFCYAVTDGTHDSPKTKENGYYLITSKHLTPYAIDFSSAKRISEEDYLQIIKRSAVEQWDILFSMIGTIGIIYLEKNTEIDYACKNIGIFKFNGDKEKAYWLYYYFQTPQAKEYILRHLRGTTQQYLPLCSLRDFPIAFPSKELQKKITSVLSALDDKIELNNRIIANLEHQAQAIFGNLFPDCMSNGIAMSSILDVRDGTHDSPKSKETGYYLITSKHLQPYSVNKNEANLISGEDYNQINERSKVEYGDILISMIGTVGLISLVSDENVDFAIKNVGLFRTSQNESLRYYILNYLKSNDVTVYIEQHLAGSIQKYISLSELRNLPINIPSKDEIIRFNSIVKPIYRYIINLNRENLRLVAIRDTLLPKLMSGEIKV